MARHIAQPLEIMGFSHAERAGRIAKGCRADIAVLDWENYTDRGTVQQPSQLALGAVHVLVNGVPALLNGQPTGLRAGQLLRY